MGVAVYHKKINAKAQRRKETQKKGIRGYGGDGGIRDGYSTQGKNL
jgi:hypothetical protein